MSGAAILTPLPLREGLGEGLGVTGRLKCRHEWALQMPPLFLVILYLTWSCRCKWDLRVA
jgi:hypothetical protein